MEKSALFSPGRLIYSLQFWHYVQPPSEIALLLFARRKGGAWFGSPAILKANHSVAVTFTLFGCCISTALSIHYIRASNPQGALEESAGPTSILLKQAMDYC